MLLGLLILATELEGDFEIHVVGHRPLMQTLPRYRTVTLLIPALKLQSNHKMLPALSALLLLLLGSATTNALHFYLDANQKRCFIEELPTDTVVEGILLPTTFFRPTLTVSADTRELPRHGMGRKQASVFREPGTGDYRSGLGMIHFVFHCYSKVERSTQESESGDIVVKTTGPSQGKFTFTSHDAGDHSICLSTNFSSWFSHNHIRLYLDVVVGTTKADVEHDRKHVSGLAAKIRDLNQKLEDIRREQQYQREREADYRDLSEATNTRAVWYSIAQIVVLIATCTWQLRHLKVCSRRLLQLCTNHFVFSELF